MIQAQRVLGLLDSLDSLNIFKNILGQIFRETLLRFGAGWTRRLESL